MLNIEEEATKYNKVREFAKFLMAHATHDLIGYEMPWVDVVVQCGTCSHSSPLPVKWIPPEHSCAVCGRHYENDFSTCADCEAEMCSGCVPLHECPEALTECPHCGAGKRLSTFSMSDFDGCLDCDKEMKR